MSIAMLVTAVLVGPQPATAADIWRDEYRAVLAATAERVKPEPEHVVPRLIALYTHLDNAEALPRFERTRMRRTLEGRLVKQLERLLVQRRRHDLAARRAGEAGGGATAFAAQQLIDVIVTTIAPDSWRQNGGNGSISFYPINPALVIRQTGEVHEEVSALLRALGK